MTRFINNDCKICSVGQDNRLRSKNGTWCYDNRTIKYEWRINCQIDIYMGLHLATGGLLVFSGAQNS